MINKLDSLIVLTLAFFVSSCNLHRNDIGGDIDNRIADLKMFRSFEFSAELNSLYLSYNIPGKIIEDTGTQTPSGSAVLLQVPIGTDVSNLVPAFLIYGSGVDTGGAPVISGMTALDFTTDQVFTITANNSTTRNYDICVRNYLTPDITSTENPIVNNHSDRPYEFTVSFNATINNGTLTASDFIVGNGYVSNITTIIANQVYVLELEPYEEGPFTLYLPLNRCNGFLGMLNVASNTVSREWDGPPTSGNGGVITVTDISSGSISINWAPASDRYTAANDLVYTAVRSDSNDLGSVAAAQTNGEDTVTNAPGVTGATFNGLAEGTWYWFTVLAEDLGGNVGKYNTISVRTEITFDITASFVLPADETIDSTGYTEAHDGYWMRAEIVNAGDFDSFVWYLDGVLQTGLTGPVFDIQCYSANFPGVYPYIGYHTMTCIVTDSGAVYTKNFIFGVGL